VFRIAAAPDRDRREPTLTGAPRLVSPDPSRLAPPERLTPIAARERARWLGPITSLVLHLMPLLLLIEWPMAAPPVVEPITVQLVLEPPPPSPPPPSTLPPKPEFKPPPPGRIASEDLGDTEMKEASREPSDQPAAKNTSPPPPPEKTEVPPPPPEKTEPPPESPQQTAAIVPPPPPEKPTPPKPQAKPNPNARQALREEEPVHTASRRAKYPGPAATRDEYLAYVHSLIRQHYNMLPLAMVGGRRGETQVEFVVLDDGTIGAIRLRQSSGWQDIDARVELMIAAVRRVPPLPQWFQGPSMALVLNLPFPDALRE
jgi:outer membrane biosynthesis protein TonB